MPSTFTSSLRLVLPATGELSNTWGTVFNAGATSLIDNAIAGTASITMTAANYTLSNNNGVSDESRSMFLVLGGTPGGSYQVICPAVSKLYFVTNNTGFAQTVKTSAGTGISVPNGARVALRCDGTDVVEALNYASSLTLGSPLAVGSGGTGAATFTANNVLLGNGTSAFQVVAPGASGNILTSNGTTWQSTVPVASGVASISFGTTGLTPSTATTGAVTVAGTLVAVNGGTGQTTYAVGDLLYASTTTALSKLADVATGNSLISGGVGVAPSWGKIGLTTHVSGTLPVANGGTNATATPTAGAVAYGTGTAYAFNTAGTSGQPLLSGGAGVPTFGTLSVGAGGTGATTLTLNNVVLGNGTSAVQFVAPGTNGNVLTSNGTTWTSAAAGASSLSGQTDSASPFETSLGVLAGAVSTGANVTFIGYSAGTANTTGQNNTAVGSLALDSNTVGIDNTVVGFNAGQGINTGTNNTAVGSRALSTNTTASNNTAFGYQALRDTSTGTENTAVGTSALIFNSTGIQNTAVGSKALQNTTVSNMTAVGYSALLNNTTGTGNTAVGSSALKFNTVGTNNTAVGFEALTANTTGASNTAVGYNAGINITTGTNLTCLGNSAAASTATATNEITLGNASIATIRAQVTTITALSDARDKTDIAPLSAGLAFTNALKPVAFTWNMRDGGKVGIPDTGFIAQDLKAVQEQTGVNIPGLVYESNPDRLEAGYGKLLPVLVKAIQELSAKVEALEAQLKGN